MKLYLIKLKKTSYLEKRSDILEWRFQVFLLKFTIGHIGIIHETYKIFVDFVQNLL